VYDAAVCTQLADYVLGARERGTRLTPSSRLGTWARMRASVLWLLSPYL